MDENEAHWAGLIVSAIMLGSGFSLLLFPVFTGYGAVILSLGIMTMIVVLMTKTVVIQIQKWMDYNARIEETVANILALRTQVVEARSQADVSQPEKGEVRAIEPKVEKQEEIAAA